MENFKRMHLSGKVMMTAGATEVIAAIALLIGLALPALAIAAAIGLVLQMLVAAAAETRGGNATTITPPLVLAAAATVAVLSATA